MLKLAGSKEEPAPATPTNDAPLPDSGFGDDTQASSDDKPFDSEPFDAGVEADEESDPKKFIEQLTGKLGQSLRKYNESQGQPDYELEKFAINSLLAACHTGDMDQNDQDDIIKKVKSGGKDDSQDDNQDNNDNSDVDTSSTDDGSNDFSGDIGGDNGGDTAPSPEINEETEIFLANPKKNNMFQPGSNDHLTESCWKGYKQLGMKEKGGKQVPNCVPVNENSDGFDFIKSAIESASGDKVQQREVDDENQPLYWSLTNKYVNYYIGSDDQIILYNGETGERYPIGELKHYNEPRKIKEGLNVSEKSSIFNNIKKKLKETFNQEDTMSEPMIEPQIAPTPTVTPEVKPNIAPSRKNKPFLPMPEVKPDPKAIKENKSDYEIYHKTLSSSLDSVRNYIVKKGFDNIEFDINDVQHVNYGKTERFVKPLTINGKVTKYSINVQIYRMDSGNYELNMYLS